MSEISSHACTCGRNFRYTFLIFLCFGLSILPLMYLLTFAFNVPSSGYVWATVINIFSGMTLSLLVSF